MLGLYTLIDNKQSERLTEDHYFINSDTVKSGYSIDRKSPIKQFEYENWNIFIEGAIYNLKQSEIKSYLVNTLKYIDKKGKIIGIKNERINYTSGILSLLIYVKRVEELYGNKIKIEN
jgi:hypothetical protein